MDEVPRAPGQELDFAQLPAELHPRADKPVPPKAISVANEIRALPAEYAYKCAELRAAMKG